MFFLPFLQSNAHHGLLGRFVYQAPMDRITGSVSSDAADETDININKPSNVSVANDSEEFSTSDGHSVASKASSADSVEKSGQNLSSDFSATTNSSSEKNQKKNTGSKNGRILAGQGFSMDLRNKIDQDAPDYLREFLNYMLTIKGRSANTVESYYLDLRVFFRFLKVYQGIAPLDQFHEILISDFPLERIKKIRLPDIYAYLNFCMRTLGNGDQARARKSSCLRTFFKYLHKMNYIPENPTKDLELPAIKKRLPKHLTLNESIEVLEHVESDFPARDFCMLTFFLNCGMRVSELVGINISSIQENALRIIGKGNKERIVFLNQSCMNALSAHLEERRKLPEIKEIDALFLSRTGRRISKRRVQQIVEYNLKKNGLVGYSTHKLRHTAATLLYQHGYVDIRVLKELLGHASLSTTEIYTHVSNEQVADAVGKSPLQDADPSSAKKKPVKISNEEE